MKKRADGVRAAYPLFQAERSGDIGPVIVVCYLFRSFPSSVGCVGMFDDNADIHAIIEKHALEHNLNPLLDYAVFRGIVEAGIMRDSQGKQ